MDKSKNIREKFRIGLIVNPLAGIGGSVALKGSDGQDIVEKAFSLGAKPKAEDRAGIFLKGLENINEQLFFVTSPSMMGENILKGSAHSYEVIDFLAPKLWQESKNDISAPYSSALDTLESVQNMQAYGVDLLVFVGGDGTARDVYTALSSRGRHDVQQLCLGVPAGVKIHSAVYATTPASAAEVIQKIVASESISLHRGEVRDIDESKLRQGLVASRYFGELPIPKVLNGIQTSKQGAAVGGGGRLEHEAQAQAEIADYLVEQIEPGCLYIVGGGLTTKCFKDALFNQSMLNESALKEPGLNEPMLNESMRGGSSDGAKAMVTLLGVDLFVNGELVLSDAGERGILEQLKLFPRVKIIVSVIGGQGSVFGRGNQQISPEIINEVGIDNILILATPSKLADIGNKGLFVDTGDEALDQKFAGLRPVVTAYEDVRLFRVNGK